MLVPPPLYAVLAGAAQRVLSDPRPRTPGRTLAAVAVAAGSVAMAGGAATLFHRHHTTVEPMDPSRATHLVTSGANSISRNPMYLGMTGLLLAHALVRGSWAALLPVGGFVLVVDRVQIRAEEAALSAHFGEEYDAYRARVPRWLDARSWPSRRPPA